MKHRIRLSGLIRRDNELLLVEQRSPTTGQRRWGMPGGGLEHTDDTILKGVEREMLEETGLEVRAGQIRFTNEFIHIAYNVLMVDLWLDCHPLSGDTWPEPHLANIRPDDYITDARWWSYEALRDNQIRTSPFLLKPEFWAHLDAPAGNVMYLGRWSE